MTALDQCRALLAEAVTSLGDGVPGDSERALLALLRAGEGSPSDDESVRRTPLGWNLALRLCLEARTDGTPAGIGGVAWQTWAEHFLAACAQAARAELALARCAAGSLQLQEREVGEFVAWPLSRRVQAEQRERADLKWWSAQLAQQATPQTASLAAERAEMRTLLHHSPLSQDDLLRYVASKPEATQFYQRLGRVALARLAPQHSYPADATIGGATFARYGEILALLIGWLYLDLDRRAPGTDSGIALLDKGELVAALAAALGDSPEAIGQALQYLILDRENAAYHGAALGQTPPPLIRVGARRLVWSARGLLGEPFIFLARELRRRHAQEYHNSAHLREGIFRADLYRLFGDKRFVVSSGRVELKRSGAARTDLDALIFDRKSGTLGIFELKAQDPFARSVEERQRQRDNFYHANRQVSAALEWVQRRGADDLLVRFSERTSKQYRVQKVHAFVLGRYLAHFDDGPEPDRRAAWGSWPQVLQLVGQEPFGPNDRNPLATLFNRLRDASPPQVLETTTETIEVGALRLHIFPSFAALRAV